MKNNGDIGVVLNEWRTSVLDGFLAVITAMSVPALVTTLAQTLTKPEYRGMGAAFIAFELVLIAILVLRNLPVNLRIGALLLLGYVLAAFNLYIGGFNGAGPIYLLALPILAVVFTGRRAGIICAASSALLVTAFAVLIGQGVLVTMPVRSVWAALSTTLLILVMVMGLLVLFYNFQERLIIQEHRTQAELRHTQALLEQQNAGLEQKIVERTQEMDHRNKILTALYEINEAASASRDIQAFYTYIHGILAGLMYARNMFIAVYDEASGMLSFPYFVDEQDEPFPAGPLSDFHGMTGYMIRTGNSIKHGWDQFNALAAAGEIELVGSYNEDGIGAPLKAEGKIIGAIYIQSYTRGIHYSDQDDEVLAFVAQHIATALARFRTLEAEHQHIAELDIINSVQSGLAADLDFQDLIELVGDKLRQAFATPNLIISWYEEESGLVHYLYAYEHGERLVIAPQTPSPTGILHRLIRLRQQVGYLEYGSEPVGGAPILPGTDACLSGVAVPIASGERVMGVIQLENFERAHAYGEAELRLLTTVAASLGAALEKARLSKQRKEAVEALRQSEARYRLIAENSDDVIWTTDPEYRLTYVSPSIYRLRGVDTGEAMQEALTEVMPPAALQTLIDEYSRVKPEIEQGKDVTIRLEVEQYRKDHSTVWVELSRRPMRDSTGRLTGFVGVSRDISDRKQAEAELKEAKNAAETANRSKTAFLANMSHEIRTPMNAILGFAQLMQRDPGLTPRQSEYLQVINRSGEHLLALINDILELSKIEAGRATFIPTTFDLPKLLDDMEMMFRVRTEDKKLWLMVEKVGRLPQWIITDEGKLRQVLINLMGNAVKFTQEGGIGVRAGVQPGPGGKNLLVVEVEDTGPGISAQEMDNLFKVFEQASSGLKMGGTGLGLALSRGFVTLMGGTITVSSTEGQGSIFKFSIPFEEGQPDQVERKETTRRVLRLKPRQDEIRVLVADDRETNRQLLTQMLTGVGFSTKEVANGEEALAAFSGWQPRIILMDMSMPVMDGYQATRAIKALPEGKNAVIIAVTASAFQEDRQRVIEAGADGYLAKPFKEADLFETIRRLSGVAYLYDEGAAGEQMIVEDETLTWSEALAALPHGLVEACRLATENADIFRLKELLDEVSAHSPSVAQKLDELAGRYEYEEIISLLTTTE